MFDGLCLTDPVREGATKLGEPPGTDGSLYSIPREGHPERVVDSGRARSSNSAVRQQPHLHVFLHASRATTSDPKLIQGLFKDIGNVRSTFVNFPRNVHIDGGSK